jgi:hypothetical protein
MFGLLRRRRGFFEFVRCWHLADILLADLDVGF